MSLWTIATAAERAANVAVAAERLGLVCAMEVTRRPSYGYVVAAVFGPDGGIVWATAHDGDPLSQESHDGEVFMHDGIKAEMGA